MSTHTHHLSVDASILASNRGIRTLKISLIGLLLTACFQVVIVFISGSAALLADTIHNFADAFTSVPLWIAFSLSRRKPTRAFSYGYGKAEDLAGIAIVLVIASSAVLAGYESVRKLLHPEVITDLSWVVAAGVVGFLGNEIVAEYRLKTGKEIGSAALVADGQHSRIDGLTSLAVLLGALGVWLGFPLADPIVGLLITVIIMGIVAQTGREIFRRMMDAVDESILEEIKHSVGHMEGVLNVRDVRARWIGHGLFASLSVGITPEIPVAEVTRLIDSVRTELLHHVPHLQDVLVVIHSMEGATN